MQTKNNINTKGGLHMPTDNMNNVFVNSNEERSCCNNNSSGCCNSEILFFIIIFLLLFTNFGCCGNG